MCFSWTVGPNFDIQDDISLKVQWTVRQKQKYAYCDNDGMGLSSIILFKTIHKNFYWMKKGRIFIEHYRALTVVFDSV